MRGKARSNPNTGRSATLTGLIREPERPWTKGKGTPHADEINQGVIPLIPNTREREKGYVIRCNNSI